MLLFIPIGFPEIKYTKIYIIKKTIPENFKKKDWSQITNQLPRASITSLVSASNLILSQHYNSATGKFVDDSPPICLASSGCSPYRVPDGQAGINCVPPPQFDYRLKGKRVKLLYTNDSYARRGCSLVQLVLFNIGLTT